MGRSLPAWHAALVDLLVLDLVIAHPLVLGEIACGTPPRRVQTLADLDGLQQARQASVREVMAFIARERLFGLACTDWPHWLGIFSPSFDKALLSLTKGSV